MLLLTPARFWGSTGASRSGAGAHPGVVFVGERAVDGDLGEDFVDVARTQSGMVRHCDVAGDLTHRAESTTKILERSVVCEGNRAADDWGTQDGLMLSPDLWRRLFKPGYRKQFSRAHDLGLDEHDHGHGQHHT